ncbi:MAG: anti-sigma B factor antagonist [Minisyncoccia bacterium]|jgi:anti-sigma B factor antagonist|tara:strand:- start:261 stop:569 length:309 start_codon:yes stop_codon:yes gene_type:complete
MLITTTPATPDGPTTFALSGRFDAHEADSFRSAVDPAIKTGNPAIDVNLSDVEFLDSTALAELVRLMKHCREKGGDLRLVSPSNPVTVILELTRLNVAFTIV